MMDFGVGLGAERAGRDPSKIRTWARTEVLVCNSKAEAVHEASSYASSCAEGLWLSALRWNRPEAADLFDRLEKASPGIVDEIKNIHDNFNPYQHESILATHKQYATQRIIDMINLTGTPEEIRERIHDLQELGLYGVSCVQFAIYGQKANMREIANSIMPYFR